MNLRGLIPKKPVTRCNETDSVKLARRWFAKEFITRLKEPNTTVLYFDWTSFAQSNLRKRAWSEVGTRAVVMDSYGYQKLHMLAILGPQGVQSVQFVSGGLCSQLIFTFLRRSLTAATHLYHQNRKNVVLV